MEGFRIAKSGIFSTIQDLGRWGYQDKGIPPNGVLDDYSSRMANVLVGNSTDECVIEMCLQGCSFEVLNDCVVALTGADTDVLINGLSCSLWSSMRLHKGDYLEIGGVKSGFSIYMSVAGGFKIPNVLGSTSTDTIGYIGGIEGRPLMEGDIIRLKKPSSYLNELEERKVIQELIPCFSSKKSIRTIMGPQHECYSEDAISLFLSSDYIVSSKSDRSALRLTGPLLTYKEGESADLLSEGIVTGSIQVPQGGSPIVFLAGRRTVGGYKKIATVISADLFKISQSKPGDIIRFSAVELREAYAHIQRVEYLFNNPECIVTKWIKRFGI